MHADDEWIRRVLCDVIADPGRLLELAPHELDLAIRLLRLGRVLGRVAAALSERGMIAALPHPLPDVLNSAIVSAQARARVARWELDRVAWALAGHSSVPLVVLKGCAYLLCGTPNAAGRLFSDVDLLVPKEALHVIEQRLLQKGWHSVPLSTYDAKYYREWAHELPALTHPEREVEVDLHHNIAMPTGRLKPPASMLLEQARPLHGVPYKVLQPIDMVLHAMTHLFYGGEMEAGFRELLDVADLLTHFGASEAGFWQAFWPRAEALGLTRPAFYGVRYALRWLGAPVPVFVMDEAARFGPPAAVLRIMDSTVTRVIFPAHPDRRTLRNRVSNSLLYARSHWVRMPPLMLAKHFVHKVRVRALGSGGQA